ncbi:MAG: TrkA family potassium uptake protein [Halanaerobiales bacterium]|nr:TrkA family potassium uptake protein [Halanaerobiales bacterium]
MKQFVVIGLGRFGSSVARTLTQRGCDVLAIDSDGEKVQSFAMEVTHAVQADATDEETMKSLGVRNFDVAIISTGSDLHASILTTLIVKELGVEYVVVKAQTELQGKVLTKIGADRVVYPERDMGIRVANSLVSSNVLDYIELSPDYTIQEVIASPKFYGHSLSDLQFRTRFGVNVIAIKNGEDIIVTLKATDEIKDGDILIVMGNNDHLEKLRKY